VDVQDRIEVIPFVSEKSVLRSHLETISIFLWPSRGESFGILLAEAMASGCAVIATPAGYGASLKHLEDSYILRENSEDALYLALNTLLDDPATRRRIAELGQKTAQNLDWAKSVETLEATYQAWAS
jgi:phosphatidylinositol alpha-mannosyltransferase